MPLLVLDKTFHIGSEVRTDVDTLLSGKKAQVIRELLEKRGVIFFRGLEINDDQQVCFAKTIGNTVGSEGDNGIYKVSSNMLS